MKKWLWLSAALVCLSAAGCVCGSGSIRIGPLGVWSPEKYHNETAKLHQKIDKAQADLDHLQRQIEE